MIIPLRLRLNTFVNQHSIAPKFFIIYFWGVTPYSRRRQLTTLLSAFGGRYVFGGAGLLGPAPLISGLVWPTAIAAS